MSFHMHGIPVERHIQPTDGYAFMEDARDATRYVQRVAVLRQALYHGEKTGPEHRARMDSSRSSVGERF